MKILRLLLLSILFVGMYSCSSSDDGGDGGPQITSIVLTANVTTQMVGNNINFTVTTNTGTNVTADAVIKVGTTAISGTSYTSATAGSFDVTATYEGLTSSTVTIVFTEEEIPDPIAFEKRILVEDYTGTWCGWCPRVSYGIEQVGLSTDKAVFAAIHRGGTDPNGQGYDPWNFNATALENLIGLQGYPTAMLNRMTEWTYPEPNNIPQVVGLTQGAKPNVGLAMTASVSGGNINLVVNTKYGADFSGTKLIVYVQENGLIFDQTNYTTYYGGNGGNSYIPNFEHNHVVKACLTNLLGDIIAVTESVHDNVYTKTFSVPVPANISNTNNIEFVAFIVGADKKVINVRKSVPGDDQTFEVVQ